MPGTTAAEVYTRDQVRRLLGISAQLLRSWEKQELIPHRDSFAFRDLVVLRTLQKLRANRVPTARIQQTVAAVRKKLQDVADPLQELRIYCEGRKIAVQVGDQKMDPISGQLLLDFDEAELNKLKSFPRRREASAKMLDVRAQREADFWFQKGLELEQRGASAEQVIEAYERAVTLDPKSAGALVNLGTVYFYRRDWNKAEQYYRQVIDTDPTYALAHFNLANLLDERGDRLQAQALYLETLRLNPDYADAHYNLALLYQGAGQVMKAVRHWKIYLKLDPASSWAVIARRELDKLRAGTVLNGGREPRGPETRGRA